MQVKVNLMSLIKMFDGSYKWQIIFSLVERMDKSDLFILEKIARDAREELSEADED